MLLDHLGLDERLARADLVVTAEGALDRQTPRGKVPAEVARRAKLSGRPVLALAGTLGEGAGEVPGVDACHGILPGPMELAEALVRGAELLTDATERALRMIILGARLPSTSRTWGSAPDPAPQTPEGPNPAGRVRDAAAVHRPEVPAGAVPDELPHRPHEPRDMLLRRPDPHAHADRVQRPRLRRPALPRPARVPAQQPPHQRVRAEQTVPHTDAVLGGQRGGEVGAVPAVDHEGQHPDARRVVPEQGQEPHLRHIRQPVPHRPHQRLLPRGERVEAGLGERLAGGGDRVGADDVGRAGLVAGGGLVPPHVHSPVRAPGDGAAGAAAGEVGLGVAEPVGADTPEPKGAELSVEMFTVLAPSPPVPTMSTVAPGTSITLAWSYSARTQPVISSTVSPLARRDTAKPAICASVASPRMMRSIAQAASSADRSRPSRSLFSRAGQERPAAVSPPAGVTSAHGRS
ncbi:hypothetical protein STENM223S_11228 [Streptomyces tendae]